MLIPKTRIAADYRLQAAHIREFLETVHDDDQLRAVLLNAAARLDRLADEWAALDGSLRKARKRSPRMLIAGFVVSGSSLADTLDAIGVFDWFGATLVI